MNLRRAAAGLLVAFALLGVACGKRPSSSTQQTPLSPTSVDLPQPPKVEKPRDPATEKTDFAWTADELRKEFGNNSAQYRQKYRDSIIEVTGTVYDFDPFSYYSPANTITVQLKTQHSFMYFHMAGREPWARAVPGQEVTLRGRPPRDTEFINEALVQCVVVEPKESPALALTGEQLVREARADPKKYISQWMIVSGEVLSKNKVNAVFVELTGDDQTKVRCQVPSKMALTIDSLKAGQRIKVLGRYVTHKPPHGVILDRALPITGTGE